MMPARTVLSTPLVTADQEKGRKATDLFRHAYNGVQLTEKEAQKLNENPNFPDELDKLIRLCSRIHPMSDGFAFIKEYPMKVPANYRHEGYLGRFRKAKTRKFRYGIREVISDGNYAQPSHELVPGKIYMAKQYAITREVSSEDCLGVYASEQAYLTGAQGAAMHWELCRAELPLNRWALSFDQKDRLPLLGDYRGVPDVYRHSVGEFGFDCGYFGGLWYDDCVLVLLCDFPPKAGSKPSGA